MKPYKHLCRSTALIALSMAILGPAMAQPVTAVKEQLIALEKQSWEAWKASDGQFMQSFLIEEAIQVGATGVDNKATIVKRISSSDCEVRSYSLDNFGVVMLDTNTGILTFKANQDATCKGTVIPATVWASSIYLKRGGEWLNAFYQETAATASQ